MLKREKPNHFETIVRLLIVLAMFALVFILPFVQYYYYGTLGLTTSGILILVLSPFISYTFKKFIYFKDGELKKAFHNTRIQLGLVFVINLFIFLLIGLKTFIEIGQLLRLYVYAYLPLLVFSFIKPKVRKVFNLIPLFLSMGLFVNFTFTTNEVVEKYKYKSLDNKSTLIRLENDAYEKYQGVRFFFYEEGIFLKRKVLYTVADGYFGVKVVKKREFTN